MSNLENGHNFVPDLSINWDRPNTEWDEMDNNALALNEAMVELVQARGYEEHYGTPMHHAFDDLDADTITEVPMDQEWRNMVLNGIWKESVRLEKEGIVFEWKNGS